MATVPRIPIAAIAVTNQWRIDYIELMNRLSQLRTFQFDTNYATTQQIIDPRLRDAALTCSLNLGPTAFF